ncbi:MAG TPA: leucine-rich repeat domain-containing protein [Kofleriaceae bacterium]|nr:leucine-rich repeat domain-containing protein [Kofleriaceae bacterium]
MARTDVVDRDLEVRGDTYRAEEDLVVNGWIEVHNGALVCGGDLTCLGIFMGEGATLECRELITNFLTIDNSHGDTRVKASWIRARVVDLVQRALEDMIDRGDVTADYCQHFGGDLNPSFDYARGKLLVLPQFYEAKEDEEDEQLVLFDLDAIRKALTTGENVFRKPGPLLTLIARERPRAAAATDPTVLEMTTWIDSHPGPQRALLAGLSADWLAKLALLDDQAQSDAARVIRRALKSPKLATDVAALLAPLATGPRGEAAPNQDARSRLKRAARASEFKRPNPAAWLDAFAVDCTEIDVLYDRNIAELPSRIGDYAGLVTLSLIGTRISRLPPELGRLTKLEKLDVQQNALTSLPEEIASLTSLKSLNVEQNAKLTRLPDGVCDLSCLEELVLNDTALSTLPDAFGRLAELDYLSLTRCERLTALPESFFSLPKLRNLNLHGTRMPGALLGKIRAAFPTCNFGNCFAA